AAVSVFAGESRGGRSPLLPEKLSVMADDVPSNRASLGRLCGRGRFGTGFIHSRDRITSPMVRRDGRWIEVGWDEALDAAAEGLARHRGRFGALASAKATNEDGYVVQKLCRVVMGTNDVDHCTRLCHSPSVEAMLASMGSGATSNSYQDYEEAGCLMVVGADASANHPVIAIRFRRAVSRGARLIVINPKRVELCDQADLWIQQRPGTDVALFNAMSRVILDEGLAANAFIGARTEGFEAWRESLAPFTLEHASRVTGVPAEDQAAGTACARRHRDRRGGPLRGDARDVRRGRESPALRARPAPRREGDRPARLPGGPGPLHARDRRARARLPARRGVRREGRHLHQLRAPRPACPSGATAARLR